MTDTRFVCSARGMVLSGDRANIPVVVAEGDETGCPDCGSTRIEPYDFDPDARDRSSDRPGRGGMMPRNDTASAEPSAERGQAAR